MKGRWSALLILGATMAVAMAGPALAARDDVIWARSTNGAPITLDGKLDEPAWAAAETKIIRYRLNNGLPGSGWKDEIFSPITPDSTYATVKFLTVGNQLYMGATFRDSSIGGGGDFNRFDGVIMSLKDHACVCRPAPTMEYTYTWWAQTIPPGPGPVGGSPYFAGRWATPPWGSPRTGPQIAAWDAVTKVKGVSNSDTAPDTSYTIEMRFDLGVMGYDVTQSGGDIIEWNMSVYDCDWRWAGAPAGRTSSNRTWWEDPWGNTSWYGEVEIHADPTVTVSSGPVPQVDPRVIIPNASDWPTPVINGTLNEQVWSLAPGIHLTYGDDALRDSYGPIAKWRSGQYQPEVNGGTASVLDQGDASVKWFFKGDTLYLGFDVNDQVVQYAPNFTMDRWDGFVVSIGDRQALNADHVYTPRGLDLIVGPGGTALGQDYLPFLRDSLHGAKYALVLKPGTTVDTVGTSADVGYTAELAIDLTKLGYPPGLGDHLLFFGIDLLDGDSFTPFTFSYGTRTWWYQERPGSCCPAYALLDAFTNVTAVDGPSVPTGARLAILGNAPNPWSGATSLRFALGEASRVSLEVFDPQGRRVARRDLGLRGPGVQEVPFREGSLRNGLYFYRVTVSDPRGARLPETRGGKMMLIR